MIWPIFLAALAIYCIFKGVKTLITGRLSAREEEGLVRLSRKGAKIYRRVYSVIYILGALFMIGYAVIKLMELQNMILNMLPFRIAVIIIVLLLSGILIYTRIRCEKIQDDENENSDDD